MRERGVAPVVGKVLEIGVVLVYVSVVAGVLFGSVVPGYRTTAGAEVADRALADAAATVRETVPASGNATASARLDLPERVRGEPYVLRGAGRTLVFDHPNDALDRRYRLALPPDVTVRGAVRSTAAPTVTANRTGSGVVVEVGAA